MLNLDIPSTCQIPGLEAFYYGVFGDRMTDRYFVEVGAYDGITYSNTYGLAKAGWSGLYVEPVPHLAEQCRGNHKDHPGIVVAEYAVADYSGTAPLYYDGQELYTLKERFIEISSPAIYQHVPVKTLNWLLDFHSINKFIDLLVIDAEGSELDILAGFSLAVYVPKMIIIEAHEGHRNAVFGQNATAINKILDVYGYLRIYSDEINNIYVHRVRA